MESRSNTTTGEGVDERKWTIGEGEREEGQDEVIRMTTYMFS